MGRNSAWLLLLLALGLLILPIWWVLAAVLAALWHEGCHYFALRLVGGQALGVRAGLNGAVMVVRFDHPAQEIICALAGPAGSLLLLLLVRWLPRTAICGGLQGVYNLLPIFPLDGGRAVRQLSTVYLSSEKAKKLCDFMEIACISGIAVLSLYGYVTLHLGIAPLLVGAGIIWRAKIPCKPWRNSVQWKQ